MALVALANVDEERTYCGIHCGTWRRRSQLDRRNGAKVEGGGLLYSVIQAPDFHQRRSKSRALRRGPTLGAWRYPRPARGPPGTGGATAHGLRRGPRRHAQARQARNVLEPTRPRRMGVHRRTRPGRHRRVRRHTHHRGGARPATRSTWVQAQAVPAFALIGAAKPIMLPAYRRHAMSLNIRRRRPGRGAT
jgi:hypothetical protein